MVVFIQKAHGCIFFCYAIEAQAAQLAIFDRLQKKQRNFGRYKAMKNFMQDDVKRLSWSAPIFNNGKVDSNDGAIADGGIFVSLLKCL